MAEAAQVAVIGAGSWGTALALQIARNGHSVRLWGHEPDHIARLSEARENAEFLPGFSLPDSIQPVSDLADAVADSDLILLVIPSKAYRQFLETQFELFPQLVRERIGQW